MTSRWWQLGSVALAAAAWILAPVAVAKPTRAEKARVAKPAKGANPPKVVKPPPAPEVLADDQKGAHALGLDRTALYFLTDDAVVKLPKAGGAPIKLAVASAPFDLSSQRDKLYWTEPSTGALKAVDPDGGRVVVIAQDRPQPRFLTTDAVAIYWEEERTGRPVLWSMRRTGSNPNELVYLDGSFVDLQSAGGNLYWADFNGMVRQVSKFGGAPEIVDRDRFAPGGRIAIDDRYVFWTHPKSNVLKRRSRTGGRAVVLADKLASPGALALGTNEVFWASNDEQASSYRVFRIPKRGGKPTVVAEVERPILDLAVDDEYLYFIEQEPPREDPNAALGRRILKVRIPSPSPSGRGRG